MKKDHLEILLEDIRGNVQLVLEGHDVLRHEMKETRAELKNDIDLCNFKIDALNDKIEQVDEKLSGKIDAVDKKLTLNLGFSHPVEYDIPEGITIKVEGNVITIAGIDKQLVGETAAQIRKFRKPEPYKGKGIKYIDEQIRRKAGKTAASKEA